jgi:septal ring-binding cell division protein DamX
MLKLKKFIGCCGTALVLSSCTFDGTDNTDSYWSFYSKTSNNSQPYPEGYDTLGYDRPKEPAPDRYGTQRVSVPESYHLGINNTPTTSKDSDKIWIDGQDPQGYTIAVTEDNKPAAVANTLLKIPKNERAAEVKSQRGSYVGVYGSYPTREAAESKLKSLPEDIQQNAKIKNWQSIQNDTR